MKIDLSSFERVKPSVENTLKEPKGKIRVNARPNRDEARIVALVCDIGKLMLYVEPVEFL